MKHWGSFVCSREVRHLYDIQCPAIPVVYFCVSPISPCIARGQCYLFRCCLKSFSFQIHTTQIVIHLSDLSRPWPGSLYDPGYTLTATSRRDPRGFKGAASPHATGTQLVQWPQRRRPSSKPRQREHVQHPTSQLQVRPHSVIGSSNPAGCEFSFLHNVQTGSGCSGSFIGVTRPGR